MSDTRHKNKDWRLPADKMETWDQVQVAVLMDIRDELRAIRQLLNCYRIPLALDAVTRIDRRMQNNGLLVGGKKRAVKHGR